MNRTCPIELAPSDPQPFLSNERQLHDIGLLVAAFFALVASVLSLWLVFKHLTFYTCPPQQRNIVRMLFMVPIYAVVSWATYIAYQQSPYYESIRDCYEAVFLTSFFYLLLQYVGDLPAQQNAVFRKVELQRWIFPLCRWKYRPNGMHFLWLMKIGILQCAIIRPAASITAVVLQAMGLYCFSSWMPWWGHLWLTLITGISITFAMYCVVQFHRPIRDELRPYAPGLKYFSVISVVFVTFLQSTILSILSYFNVIEGNAYMTSGEVQAGINSLLETFEMALLALIHFKAFTFAIYRSEDGTQTPSRGRAFLDVIDFRDWWSEMKDSGQYIRKRGPTRVDDLRAAKHGHLKEALGTERTAALEMEYEAETTRRVVPWSRSKHQAFVKTEDEEFGTYTAEDDHYLLDSTQIAEYSSHYDHTSRRNTEVPSLPPGYEGGFRDYDEEEEVPKETLAAQSMAYSSSWLQSIGSYFSAPSYHATAQDEAQELKRDEETFTSRRHPLSRRLSPLDHFMSTHHPQETSEDEDEPAPRPRLLPSTSVEQYTVAGGERRDVSSETPVLNPRGSSLDPEKFGSMHMDSSLPRERERPEGLPLTGVGTFSVLRDSQNQRDSAYRQSQTPDLETTSRKVSFLVDQHTAERARLSPPSEAASSTTSRLSRIGANGQVIQLSMPSPLSPARYPYREEHTMIEASSTSSRLASVGHRNTQTNDHQSPQEGLQTHWQIEYYD